MDENKSESNSENKIDRRRFLKKAGGVTTVSLLAYHGFSIQVMASESISPNTDYLMN